MVYFILYSGYGPHSTEATIPFNIHDCHFTNDMSFKNLQSRTGQCKNAAKRNNQLENKTHNSLKQTHKINININKATPMEAPLQSFLVPLIFIIFVSIIMFLACSRSFVVLFLK